MIKDTLEISDTRADILTALTKKVESLEREVHELRQANDILRRASAYFAHMDLDPQSNDCVSSQ